MFDKTSFGNAPQSTNSGAPDNVVYLDPKRFAGIAKDVLRDQPDPAPAGAPPFYLAGPASMAMNMALRLFLATVSVPLTRSDGGTIVMLALARVMANTLHELGASAPQQQAMAMKNMADTVSIILAHLQHPGTPS